MYYKNRRTSRVRKHRAKPRTSARKYYAETGAKVYNKQPKKQRGTFWLRVNICLGITIVLVGISKMNNDMSDKTREYIKSCLDDSITQADIENEKIKIKTMLGINKEFVIPDEEVLAYIENEKNKEN
jgi:hypothetical protein